MTNVDGASIVSATVTINTLTISGKQVTLDVFRQLQDAVLINHDGSLAGPPWGMVNYHQMSCDKLAMHVHVVWQLGDQLRQDTVQPPRWEPYWSDVCDAWVFAAGTVEPHRVTWGDDPVPPPPQNPVRPRQFRWWWPKSGRKSHRKEDTVRRPEPVRPSLPHPERPTRYIWSWPESGDKSYRDGKHALIFPIDGIECSGHLPPDTTGSPELAAEHSAADYAALLAQLEDEVAAEKERRARHEARWAEILDLPQLFIAV